MLRALALLAAAVLLAGCGDDFDPEGRPVGVTLQPVPEPHPFGEGAQLPAQQPVAVWSPYPGWEDVASVTPSPLPRPLDQGSDCRFGLKVTVRLQNVEDSVSTSEEVEYGPCRRPAEIEPLRRTSSPIRGVRLRLRLRVPLGVLRGDGVLLERRSGRVQALLAAARDRSIRDERVTDTTKGLW